MTVTELKERMQMLEAQKDIMPEFDTIDTDDVICPYCGVEWCHDQPAFEPEDVSAKKGKHRCDECGNTFKFSVRKTISCSTFTI